MPLPSKVSTRSSHKRFTDVQSVVLLPKGRIAYQYHRDGNPEALREMLTVHAPLGMVVAATSTVSRDSPQREQALQLIRGRLLEAAQKRERAAGRGRSGVDGARSELGCRGRPVPA